MKRTIKLPAFAKINLFLEILGRQRDGYHKLSTVFQEITLADDLAVSRLPGTSGKSFAVRFRCEPAELENEDNLVVRAAKLFGDDGGGFDISLKKQIPVGAGLGGGSSDAAAALKACWALRAGRPLAGFPWRKFAPKAKRLGADVSFFLRGGLASATGVGERIRPLSAPGPSPWFVLVFPRVFVSTKWAYSRLRLPLTNMRSLRTLNYHLKRGSSPRVWGKFLFNRLEEIVLPRVRAVAQAKDALLRAGSLAALMSGSGSSVFGLVESETAGRRIVAQLRRKPWDVWLVRGRRHRVL